MVICLRLYQWDDCCRPHHHLQMRQLPAHGLELTGDFDQKAVDALRLQAGFHIRHPAGGNHAGVADHQHLAGTEGFRVIGDVMPAAGTKDDFRRYELAKRAETLAHWQACSYCSGR